MSAKRPLTKKNIRHKKIINTLSKVPSTVGDRDEAIVRQFHRIQRGYSILMNEVLKEFDLVKVWLEKEAKTRRDELKSKLSQRLSKSY